MCGSWGELVELALQLHKERESDCMGKRNINRKWCTSRRVPLTSSLTSVINSYIVCLHQCTVKCEIFILSADHVFTLCPDDTEPSNLQLYPTPGPGSPERIGKKRKVKHITLLIILPDQLATLAVGSLAVKLHPPGILVQTTKKKQTYFQKQRKCILIKAMPSSLQHVHLHIK